MVTLIEHCLQALTSCVRNSLNCRRVKNLTNQSRCYVVAHLLPFLWACLQGGRVTLATDALLLFGGQKIARVYKQNFTGRVTFNPKQLIARLLSKGLE